jgi:hypothetical protein
MLLQGKIKQFLSKLQIYFNQGRNHDGITGGRNIIIGLNKNIFLSCRDLKKLD